MEFFNTKWSSEKTLKPLEKPIDLTLAQESVRNSRSRSKKLKKTIRENFSNDYSGIPQTEVTESFNSSENDS